MKIAADMYGELKKNKKGTLYVDSSNGVLAKQCPQCSLIKALDYFAKSTSGFAGKTTYCKPCAAENIRKHREKNPNYDHLCYKKRREKHHEYMQDYRGKNLEKLKENDKLHKLKNKERILAYNREYGKRNRDRITENDRARRSRSPEKFILKGLKRRARKRLLPSELTKEQHLQIQSHFNLGCALSGSKVDIHMDHVIPIAIGHGGTVYENMIPLRADINTSKNDANIFVWFITHHERYSLEQSRFNTLIKYLANLNEMTIFEYTAYVYECHNNPRDLTELDTSV